VRNPAPLLLACGLCACLGYRPLPGAGEDDTSVGTETGETDADADTDADTDVDVPTEWTLEQGSSFTDADILDVGGSPIGQWEHGPGVAVDDIDGDGDLDALFVVSWERSFGFRNVDGVLTLDESITLDGDTLPPATGVMLADLDGDGDPDGVIAGFEGDPDKILENDGSGRFTSVDLPNSTPISMSPSAADIDGDGDLDLFLPGFSHDLSDQSKLQPGAKLGSGTQLWRNEGDLRFTDITSGHYPADAVYDLTYHVQFLDYDQDDDLDIYVNNDFGGNLQIPCWLMANDGSGRYTIVEDSGANDENAAMGTSVGDVNGDGLPDFWVSDIPAAAQKLYASTGNANTPYVNYAQTWSLTAPRSENSQVGWGSRIADFDGDMLADIAVAFGPIKPDTDGDSTDDGVPDLEPDVFWRATGPGTFDDIAPELGFDDDRIGRAVVQADLDRDGRGDLLVVNRVGLTVYYARGGDEQATVRLEAGPMNREGIGTKVVLEAGDRTLTSWMLPSVIFSSSAPELYLGLNGASEGSLTVTWPDGAVTTATVRPGDDVTLTP